MSRLMSRRRRSLVALALAAFLAGCAHNAGTADDQNQRPTFYGGVTGGATMP